MDADNRTAHVCTFMGDVNISHSKMTKSCSETLVTCETLSDKSQKAICTICKWVSNFYVMHRHRAKYTFCKMSTIMAYCLDRYDFEKV